MIPSKCVHVGYAPDKQVRCHSNRSCYYIQSLYVWDSRLTCQLPYAKAFYLHRHTHSWKMLWATYSKCQQHGNRALLLAVQQQLLKDWNHVSSTSWLITNTRSTVRAISKTFVTCPFLASVSKPFQSHFVLRQFI